MCGTIILEYKNGSVKIWDCNNLETLNSAKREYVFVASAWDYSARVGNPINYYFREK